MNRLERHKYHLASIGVLLITAFLALTEGWDRYGDLWQEYQSAAEKSERVIPPEQLEQKEKELLKERNRLKLSIEHSAAVNTYDGKAGLVDLVSTTAKKNTLQMISFVPGEEDSSKWAQEVNSFKRQSIPFALSLEGQYHGLGSYVNDLENSPVDFEIQSLTFSMIPARSKTSKPAVSTTILANISAVAGVRTESTK